jgi:cyclopentanol dehydrogenase
MIHRILAGRLAGKVSLITGAARGQGATEAALFAREGAAVILGDVLDDAGREAAVRIRSTGAEAAYVSLDVTDESSWRAAVEFAMRMYGRLDILVNNAGILIRKGIEETTVEDWDRVMAVNVRGVFLGTRAVIPEMRSVGGGSIVNISSTAGLVASPGGSAAYAASKGAVRLFTKATAILHAKDRIRCNSVHPGPIATDMIREQMGDANRWSAQLDRVPLGRPGTSDDVAHGVLYLASDESSYVTGSELVIDGGITAQ